ncbi:hypothetical protein CDAR_180331 [Caerostris darwini]|uniref:Uncharacterized protein n=1 Tax=Caerostris darwini TaxID=1538125 RepID=A0AAV4NS73_9ARAC|nr:hypothetical protein CDAR_180331 [Caerostris darwini]
MKCRRLPIFGTTPHVKVRLIWLGIKNGSLFYQSLSLSASGRKVSCETPDGQMLGNGVNLKKDLTLQRWRHDIYLPLTSCRTAVSIKDLHKCLPHHPGPSCPLATLNLKE